mmetsp:Transcript_8867/g.22968  ORF Transcript_8867/g.22968 Transcript_8867/m.22968 type:complete len:268 (+) Transcript_8867:20-823(+)
MTSRWGWFTEALLLCVCAATQPRITLVSVGIGAKFAHALRPLNETAAAAGFSLVQLWSTEAELLADPLAQSNMRAMGALARQGGRPYCNVAKGIALLRAMDAGSDYVMWVDASKHHATNLTGVDVRAAVAALAKGPLPAREQLGAMARDSAWARSARAQPESTEARSAVSAPFSAYGLLACPRNCARRLCMTNGEYGNVNGRTLTAFAPLIADRSLFLEQPHVLNSNILLRVDASTRALVRAWVQMAFDSPEGFCASVCRASAHHES